ncbi:MAG TPA: hypothetical protein VFR81_00325 [Longimicrobium sp.]|nr:hypothetical protein [Longimicrobium sp.]
MLRAPPVLLILLVVFGFFGPPVTRAQDSGSGSQPVVASKGFRLEQNYPNPANPNTYIPFYLEDTLFANGETRVVSIRIVNIFRQLVAIPKAVGHPRGKDVPVNNLRYTEPGRKQAHWDGRDVNGRRVPSGVYYCELVVDGKTDYVRIVLVQPRRRSRFPFPFFRGD